MVDDAGSRLATPLRSFVEGERRQEAVKHLEAYFGGTMEMSDGRTHRRFSGSMFESFSARTPPDEVGDRDLLAVTALGVNVPPRASYWLLNDGASEVRGLLIAIGPDRSITEAQHDDVGPDSPAAQLWNLFAGLPDVGPVTAGKLLAAKRPNLIPVWDQHVQTGTGAPEHRFWLAMRNGLIEDGHLYQDLRRELNLDVSLLRVVDVVVWMDQHGRQYL